MEPLKKRVQRGYNQPWVIRKYSVIGLWPSEATLCSAYLSPTSRILDIGCGAGRTTIPLARKGHQVTGIDLSPEMVHQACRQARFQSENITWGAGDAANLPFGNSSFQGVLFSYNGIELVPGIEGKKQVLKEAWRVLQPGGHLIFTSHAIEALNRYLVFRIRRVLWYLMSRGMRRSIVEMEIGEVIQDPNQKVEVYYMQIISPRIYRKLLLQIGFHLAYYNSRQRIESNSPPRWFVDFDSDFKFYVAFKPKCPGLTSST